MERAPFSSLAYRKAINRALDRPAMVRILGKYAGKRTDQILVPGVPGFKPYNLYAFRGANPAQALKAAGGKLSGTVTVVHWTSNAAVNIAQIAEYNLAESACKPRTSRSRARSTTRR